MQHPVLRTCRAIVYALCCTPASPTGICSQLSAVMPRQDGDLPNIAVPGIVSTRAESCFATFVRSCPPDSHAHENGITPPGGSSLSGLWASNPQIHPIRTILPCCRLPSIPACGHLNPFISEEPQKTTGMTGKLRRNSPLSQSGVFMLYCWHEYASHHHRPITRYDR